MTKSFYQDILNNGGFTISAITLEPIIQGFAVGAGVGAIRIPIACLNETLVQACVLNVVNYARNINCNALGAWVDDSAHSEVWIEPTTICKERDTAIALGRKLGEIAIFDLSNNQEIRL